MPRIEEDTIRLEPFGRAVAPALVRWVTSHEQLVLWAGPTAFAFPLTVEQIERHLEAGRDPDPRMLPFKAVEAEEGRMVGYIELNAIQRQNRSASVSRVIVDPTWRGRRIGERMVRALLEIAFGQLALHRVALSVFSHNTTAIACYRRAGFREEGRARDYLRMGNGYWDLTSMAILEDEWREAARSGGTPPRRT